MTLEPETPEDRERWKRETADLAAATARRLERTPSSRATILAEILYNAENLDTRDDILDYLRDEIEQGRT